MESQLDCGLGLDNAVESVRDIASRVNDDQLDLPTPCPEYRVSGILGHLIGLSRVFAVVARKQFGPVTDNPPVTSGPGLSSDWREQVVTHLDDLALAWSEPAAWRGMTRAGGVDLPGKTAGMVALNEVVVHGWDLAVATGRPVSYDVSILLTCRTFLAGNDKRSADTFDEIVEVGADSPLLDQVIGLSGRDPGWTC